ncbi:MAG: HAMP domain-containing protein [Anaerovoracaceae bacterium]
MTRRMKQLLAAVFGTALVLSLVLTLAFSKDRFTYIVDSVYTPDAVYLIDDDGEELRIIQADSAGKKQEEIRIDKITGDRIRSLDYLTVDGNDIYVYCMERKITTNEVLSESVSLCDFGRGKLRSAWELPVTDTENQNCFSIQVRSGVLTWFSTGVNEEMMTAEAVLSRMDAGASEPEAVGVIEFDGGIGFTDFFYSDDGTIVFTTPEGTIYFADQGEGLWREVSSGTLTGEMETDSLENEFSSGLTGAETDTFDPQQVAEAQLLEPEQEEVLYIDGAEVFSHACMFPDAYPAVNESRIAGFTSDGRHTVYFMDLASKDLKSIDVSTGQMAQVKDSLSVVWGTEEIPACNLKNMRFADEGFFTATVTGAEADGALGIYENGELRILTGVTGAGEKLRFFGKWFVILFVGLLVLSFVGYQVLRITRGRFPVAAKVVTVCIPVVMASVLILQFAMQSLFVKQITDQQYKELYLVARQQMENISEEMLDSIDYDRPYDSVEYYQLRSLLTALPGSLEIWESDGEKSSQVHNFGYFWLYRYTYNQELISAYCDQNYIDVPISYYYGNRTGELFCAAAGEDRIYRTSYRDTGGEWICLAVPVKDQEGNVFAVLETGTSKASLDYAVAQNAKKVSMINLAILVILILLLVALMLVTLHPLKRLRLAIQEVTEGNLGVQTTVRGNDEIADVSRVFNQMSTTVEYSVNELTELNQGYFRFVPSKMFQLLRKSSVTDVRLGDQMHSDITILSVNAQGFSDMISSMNSAEMFRFINDVYSELVPIINEKGGVVDRFEEAGLVAFFTGSSEDAVNSAVSVCQEMDVVNSRRTAKGLPVVTLTGGISYGPVMVGIVGHRERLAATTVSEHTNLSSFLQQMAPKYAARVLTTAATAERIPEFHERYNARFIGFLHVTATDRAEKLYDVFDGDTEEIRRLKRQTKDLFERGVELYCQKDYYEARLVFIQVLKQFRMDAAAREYLYRCDQYYQMEDTSGIDVYIEAY